jgi:hypothetical protein
MSNDEKVKMLAERVLRSANIPNDQKFGSVIAILMMISIIIGAIRVLQECNKKKIKALTLKDKQKLYAQNIHDFSKKRGFFVRRRLKKLLREFISAEDYNKYGIKLVETILDEGEKLTDEEVYTLMEAANV